MRIGYNFHCFDDYLSGVEYYSLGLLRALANLNTKSDFVVFTNRPDIVNSYVPGSDNLQVKNCGFLTTRIRRILWEHLKLPGIAQKERLDVLHCPHYICPALSSTVPYIVTVHDTIAIDHPGMCKASTAAYYKLCMNKSMANAARVIAVSKFTRDRIGHHFKNALSKTAVVYPGIDDTFSSLDNHSDYLAIKDRYGLPDRYILYSGNIEPKKNLLNVLKAYKLLKEQGFEHSLVITGQRKWRSEEVLKYIRRAFPQNQVLRTGYIARKHLCAVYKMSDCLVFASLYEGFGFPPFEAFACRVPVAASSTGALKEIDKRAFLQADPQNPENLGAVIKALLTKKQLYEQQLDIAQKTTRRFNWAEAAEKTFQLYREAAV